MFSVVTTSIAPSRRCVTGHFLYHAAMPEERRSPLDGVLPWALPVAAVTLTELRFAEQIGLRVKPPVAAYLAGVPLPMQPNRVASMREIRTLWLGPDEWLVTAPERAVPELMARLAGTLARRMADRRRPGVPLHELGGRRALPGIGTLAYKCLPLRSAKLRCSI